MGKIRRFLGFLVFMCTVALGATCGAFAEEITLHWAPTYGDAPADTTCTYGETFDVPMGPEVTGRNFVSWTTNGQAFVPGQTGVDCTSEILGVFSGSVTFVGTFKPITYHITYVLNGGTNNGVNPYTYNIDSPKITLANPSRLNSTSDGWWSNPEFTGSKVKNIPAGSTGDVTVYAKWKCATNYNDDDNDNVCTLNTYNVTYNCGSGTTGTPPADSVATYDTTFVTAANTCIKEGWQFDGWAVSGTTDIKTANTGFTWLYTTPKTLTANWVQYPGNCTAGQYYDSESGQCQHCPGGYTSELGADNIDQCYTSCKTKCYNPGENNEMPANATYCTYEEDALVDGIKHFNSDECVTETRCNYADIACNFDYYLNGKQYYNENGERNTKVCISCRAATASYPNSVIMLNEGITSCFTTSTYVCTEADLLSITPEKATCELKEPTIPGVIYYPKEIIDSNVDKYPNRECDIKNCTCPSGYTYDEDERACNPDTYTITLKKNGGNGSDETIYVKYEFGYVTNPYDPTTKIDPPKLTNLPTKANKVFYGYWDAQEGGQQYIDLEGNMVGAPYYRAITEDKVLYAHWVDELFLCTAEKASDNSTCEPGYYCQGGYVIKIEKDDSATGCQRLCPEHPDGDPVTSAAGSSNISACRSTTQGVDLDDGTGGGDKVCSYHWDESTNTGDFTTDCEPIDVKYCNAGYYYDATIDPNTCIEVGEGYSSPDPNNPNGDPASMERQPNSYTITYNCGTGGGTAPTTNTSATYTMSFTPAGVGGCTKVGHSFAGWKISGTETIVNSAFTWTYPANKTLTAQWTPNVYTITLSDSDATTHGAPSTLYVKYGTGWYTDSAATNSITNLAQLPTKTAFEFESYSLGDVEIIDKTGAFLSNTFTTTPATLNVVWAAGKVNCAPGEYYTGNSTNCTPCEENYFCPGGEFTMFSNIVSGRTACPTGSTSDAGASAITSCYCAMAPNAKEMNTLDYSDPNAVVSCTIKLCQPGYHLNSGECKPCPANSYCDGTLGTNGDGSTSCATLGSGDAFTEWNKSSGGTSAVDATHCYAVCADRAVTNGHAYPIEGKETVNYDNLCEFYGISTPQDGAARGNPCDVAQLALGICVESACHSEFEMIDGVCKPCARDANALTYAPTGNCIVASCANGYHPDGYSCADDVISCTASIPNAATAYSEWSASAKSYGKCIVETCAMGYHPESNACVLDEQTCSVPHGVGTQEWDATLNQWGPCVVTSCDAGYTNDDNPNQCVDCPNKYKEGGDLAASSYVRGCEIASCMYQGEKYALEDGDCLPICTGTATNPTYDPDGTGMKYWDATHNKCVRTCLLPGYVKY